MQVIYKNGVYDITEFVQGHPGGNKILLAAGSTIEPFWVSPPSRLIALFSPLLINPCHVS
jgi:hypothetical protein